jgi:hypothetical protein
MSMNMNPGAAPSGKAIASLALMVAMGCVVPAKSGDGVDGCRDDRACGPQAACMRGTCVPRSNGDSRVLALEIQPRTDSTSARTESLDPLLGPDPLLLYAEEKVTVKAVVTDVERQVFSDAARIVALLPSRIAGRGSLQLETNQAAREFSLGVGRSLIGQTAAVWLLPTTEAPGQPPVAFAPQIAETMMLALPRSADLITVRGTLLTALEEPAVGFVARAYAEGQLISNAAITQATGLFELLVAPSAVPASAAGMISIELQPPGTGASAPRLVTGPVPLGPGISSIAGKAPVYHLPAFGTPGPLRFKVLAGEVNPAGVSGATVRFRTEIAAAPAPAVAVYVHEGRTDLNGFVEALLIPGTLIEARHYDVTVIPPLDSPYAAKCVRNLSVTAVGSSNQAQYGADLLLLRKVTLAGTVTDSAGSPVVGMNVAASRMPDAEGCAERGRATPAVVTDRSGHYSLAVDPGLYQLDLDPPSDAPVPRLTLGGTAAVTVTEDSTRNVSLPAGVAMEGDVLDAVRGAGLEAANVRVYEILCMADGTCGGPTPTPPALHAQARTDAAGKFRAVLPAP